MMKRSDTSIPSSPLGYGQARTVLKDVQWIRDRLEMETDDTAWRILWASCIVLLRTVGYVASKVDGKTHPSLAAASDRVFRSWSSGEEHRIFREFIDRERHMILKEYDTTMSEGLIPLRLDLENADGERISVGSVLPENIYRPMEDGYWEGEDGRDVIDLAISWWKSQLLEMERIVDLIEAGMD